MDNTRVSITSDISKGFGAVYFVQLLTMHTIHVHLCTIFTDKMKEKETGKSLPVTGTIKTQALPYPIYEEWTCPSLSFGWVNFHFRCVKCDFVFLSHFSLEFLCALRIAPDGTPHSATSHLGLCCLPMSHKKDVRLI